MSHEEDPGTHVFLSPEVIEVHLQKNLPIPEGTARLMWALKILFEGVDDGNA